MQALFLIMLTKMNRLPLEKRCEIIHLLVEGTSLRAIERLTGCSINTITKILIESATAVGEYQDKVFRNLQCKKLEIDEIWSFAYCKQKNINKVKKPVRNRGDVWTWVGMCPDTRLVPSWYVGDRSAKSAKIFIQDLASRLTGRINISSDGYAGYVEAIDDAFGTDVDYGMVVKQYGANDRYIGSDRKTIVGKPSKISTSLVERQNLTMRMGMRRFTRKTNGFSKKLENHFYAVSLHFMYYNFGRIHKSLRVTPAMEAGISGHIWSLEEIAGLVKEEAPKERGAYGRDKLTNGYFSK